MSFTHILSDLYIYGMVLRILNLKPSNDTVYIYRIL